MVEYKASHPTKSATVQAAFLVLEDTLRRWLPSKGDCSGSNLIRLFSPSMCASGASLSLRFLWLDSGVGSRQVGFWGVRGVVGVFRAAAFPEDWTTEEEDLLLDSWS